MKYKKKYSESSPTRPLNYYGNSKLLAEKFVNKYKKSLIIRTNFFGKSLENPFISEETKIEKMIEE